MNIGKLAITSMKNEKKKYYFLIMNLTLACAVSIIFSHYMSNPTLGLKGDLAKEMIESSELPIMYLFLMSMSIIAVAIALVFFANETYLKNQKRTLSILAMSGASLLDITKFFAIQHFICMLAAIFFGIMVSFIGLPLINLCMNQVSPIEISIFSYDMTSYLLGFLIIIVMIFFLWLCDIGYVYRTNKFELIKSVSSMQAEDIVPGKKIFSLVGYFLPLGMILIIPPVLPLYILYMVIAMFGISGIFHSILPMIFQKLQTRKRYDAVKSMLYANLVTLVKENGMLTKMISISMMLLSILLCSNSDSSLTMTFISLSFILMISMMMLCIYNNMSSFASARSKQYQTLSSLGYDNSMLIHLIKSEQRWYFILIFLLPFVLVGIAAVKFMIYENVDKMLIAIIFITLPFFVILCEKICELPFRAVLNRRN
ncbi:FtsX-like permease family protein [[Eubacterium] hominis]|uniref:FtsX-like permease family protein n=1 Tax=[Eubacterium] hominis TaxID=2764325 RepID=UPI003A4E3C9F